MVAVLEYYNIFAGVSLQSHQSDQLFVTQTVINVYKHFSVTI